jgi:hypothetical protein
MTLVFTIVRVATGNVARTLAVSALTALAESALLAVLAPTSTARARSSAAAGERIDALRFGQSRAIRAARSPRRARESAAAASISCCSSVTATAKRC